jgi:hypothetical protein
MKFVFSIVFSNYTAQLFAWRGTTKLNKKYLGNRSIIGTVHAANEEDALAAWKTSQTAAEA